MVIYNTTILDNSTNLYEITVAINDLSGGLLITFFIFTLALILLIMFRYSGNMKRVFLGVSFLTTLITAVFSIIGLVSYNTLIFPIVLLIGSLIINVWGS